MKTKFNGILTLLLAFMVQFTFAQERVISGVVSDDMGPVADISVLVKGTKTGTVTDFDGKYSIKAKKGDVLVFSHVSYGKIEKTVGDLNIIDVSVKEVGETLETVVVTAQGNKKEVKSLGYAISKIKSDVVEAKPITDISRALKGEIAGLNIVSTTGSLGSATNINIRGYSSISGSNEPLFVIDGIPYSSDTNGDPNNINGFIDNINQTSRSSDIDPNNIKSISVLKGLAASVLYGKEGRNGVILIETKTGSGVVNENKKMSISVSSSTFLSEAHLPDYQNEYGGGFSQRFGFFVSNWGPSFNETNSSFFGSSFISNNGGTNIIVNPLTNLGDQSLLVGVDYNPEYEYKPYNSVKNFFRTGVSSTQSINVVGGGENATFSANFSTSDNKGILPENSLRRNTFSLGATAKLNNNFSVRSSITYAKTDVKSPPISAANGGSVSTFGNSSSIYANLMYTPRHIDLFSLPYQSVDGRSIYYRSGNDIQNPRWTLANAKTGNSSSRISGVVSVSYAFNDKASLSYRSTVDTYTEFTFNAQNKGGVLGNVTGFLNTSQNRNTILDNTFTFANSYEFNEDSNIQYSLGLTARQSKFENQNQTSADQLVFGTLQHFNFINQTAGNYSIIDNTIGVYADATYGYKNFAFLNASFRNDWTSTLESENNSISYFALSGSLILTDAFKNLKSEYFNYLKLRTGFGQSANFPTPYSTRNKLSLSSRDFVTAVGSVIPSNSLSRRLGNPNLKPEKIDEIEFGIDSRFLKNRIGLNVSVFSKKTNNLITDRTLDPSTGYSVTRINAGEMQTKGIEIDYDMTAIRKDNFSWKINGNFYADESEVTSLPDGVDRININSTFFGVWNAAVEGEPFGVFYGNAISRDQNGNMIVNPSDGTYLVDQSPSKLGDPNPDWNTSIRNTFKYKNLSFGFQWQYRHGGDVYSSTVATLLGRGLIDVGIDRNSNFILPGVLPDGSQNNLVLTSAEMFFSVNGTTNELKIFDGSTVRLSEISLGYQFPKKLINRTPLGDLSINFIASNLWYRALNMPKEANFDTNSLSTGQGNGRGIDLFTGPTTKQFGFSIKAKF